MGDKKNEKFMNFGPEWIQNLSNDPPSSSGSQRTSCTATTPSTVTPSVTTAPSVSTVPSASATPSTSTPSSVSTAQLTQYSKEEMVALFDPNRAPLEGLNQHPELYVSSNQPPAALQEEETCEDNQRGWVTNTRGFCSGPGSSSMGIRFTNRNIPVDRMRPRDGRPFIQQDFFTNRRTFYHPNSGRGGSRPPHPDVPPSRNMERGRDVPEPENSRRDFPSTSRWGSDANWRRQTNKNEEDDGWRAAPEPNRARPQYQEKKLSWRDDEGSSRDSENRFDRDRERDFPERVPERAPERVPEKRERPTAWTPHRTWNNESNADDLLPEWANADNLLGRSGSFDATGTFLGGSSNDEEDDHRHERPMNRNFLRRNITIAPIETYDIACGGGPPLTETEKLPPKIKDEVKNGNKQVVIQNIDIKVPERSQNPTVILPSNSTDNTLTSVKLDDLKTVQREKTPSPSPEVEAAKITSDNSDLLVSQIEKMLVAAEDDNILKFGSLTGNSPPSDPVYTNRKEKRIELHFIQPIHPTVDDMSRNNGNPFVQNSFGPGSEDSVIPNETAPNTTNFKSHDALMNELVQSLVVDDDDTMINKMMTPVGQPPMNMSKNPPPGVVGSTSNSGNMMKPHYDPFDTESWFYKDPQGRVRGPFTALEMKEWFETGYFTSNLLVCRGTAFNYVRLGILAEYCRGIIPFILPSAFIDSIIESILNQTMQPPPPPIIPPDIPQQSPQMGHPYTVEMLQKDIMMKQQQQQQQQQQQRNQTSFMGMAINPGSIPFPQSNNAPNQSQMVNFMMDNQWAPPSSFPWGESSMPPTHGQQLAPNMAPLLMPVNMFQSDPANIPNSSAGPTQPMSSQCDFFSFLRILSNTNQQTAMQSQLQQQQESQPSLMQQQQQPKQSALPQQQKLSPLLPQQQQQQQQLPPAPNQSLLFPQQQPPPTLSSQAQNLLLQHQVRQPPPPLSSQAQSIMLSHQVRQPPPPLPSQAQSLLLQHQVRQPPPPLSSQAQSLLVQQPPPPLPSQAQSLLLPHQQHLSPQTQSLLLQHHQQLPSLFNQPPPPLPMPPHSSQSLLYKQMPPQQAPQIPQPIPLPQSHRQLPPQPQSLALQHEQQQLQHQLELKKQQQEKQQQQEKLLQQQREKQEQLEKQQQIEHQMQEQIRQRVFHDESIIMAVIPQSEKLDAEAKKAEKKKKANAELRKKIEGNKKKDDQKIESPNSKKKGKNNKEAERPFSVGGAAAAENLKSGSVPPSSLFEGACANPWSPMAPVDPYHLSNDISLSTIRSLESFEDENEEFLALIDSYDVNRQNQKKATSKIKWSENNTNPAMKVLSLEEIQMEQQLQLAKMAANKYMEKDLTIPNIIPSSSTWAPTAFSSSPTSSAHWWSSFNDGFWDTPSKKNGKKCTNGELQTEKEINVEVANSSNQIMINEEVAEPINNSALKQAKPDDMNEFLLWSKMAASTINTEIDSSVFITFLQNLESPFEVKEYVKHYLGENRESAEFAKQFIDKRSKFFKRIAAPADDLCAPAAAINPALLPNNFTKSKNKNKNKSKKNKMLRIDARILGFNTTAATDRFNVGDIDMA